MCNRDAKRRPLFNIHQSKVNQSPFRLSSDIDLIENTIIKREVEFVNVASTEA